LKLFAEGKFFSGSTDVSIMARNLSQYEADMQLNVPADY
jgi:hypothetical protein